MKHAPPRRPNHLAHHYIHTCMCQWMEYRASPNAWPVLRNSACSKRIPALGRGCGVLIITVAPNWYSSEVGSPSKTTLRVRTATYECMWILSVETLFGMRLWDFKVGQQQAGWEYSTPYGMRRHIHLVGYCERGVSSALPREGMPMES